MCTVGGIPGTWLGTTVSSHDKNAFSCCVVMSSLIIFLPVLLSMEWKHVHRTCMSNSKSVFRSKRC